MPNVDFNTVIKAKDGTVVKEENDVYEFVRDDKGDIRRNANGDPLILIGDDGRPVIAKEARALTVGKVCEIALLSPAKEGEEQTPAESMRRFKLAMAIEGSMNVSIEDAGLMQALVAKRFAGQHLIVGATCVALEG